MNKQQRIGVLAAVVSCLGSLNSPISGQTAREVADRVLPSVALLVMEDEHGNPISLGSGFVVGSERLIATNLHVIEGATAGYAKLTGQAKKHDIGKSTVERALRKAEGKTLPQPKPIAGPKLKTKPKLETHTGLDAARRYYLEQCEAPEVDLDAEQNIIINALREIAGKRAMAKRAAPTFPDLARCLDRRGGES